MEDEIILPRAIPLFEKRNYHATLHCVRALRSVHDAVVKQCSGSGHRPQLSDADWLPERQWLGLERWLGLHGG